jgi:hypothetical protein
MTIKQEQTQRVFENRVLSRIFGLKMDEITRGWKKTA